MINYLNFFIINEIKEIQKEIKNIINELCRYINENSYKIDIIINIKN